MSEEEKNASLNEEVDDLFGDEPEAGSGNEETQNPSENEAENENDSNDENDEEAEKPAKTMDLTLPRHAVSHVPENDTYMIRMPVFVGVETHAFDPSEFKEKVALNAEEREQKEMDAKQMQNELIAEKLLNENTIRWRYLNLGNDEIIKQLNAHFVEWEDGLVLLKVGLELFDFKLTPVADSFLARSHVAHEVLQNDLVVTRNANLLPSLTFTETHRRLTAAVKTIQQKDKILNTLTMQDPLLRQREADEHERRSLKMKRQLENKRRLQEEKLGRTEAPRGAESAYERYERTYGAEDEEDDFVAEDDEEIEEDALEEEFERAERLNRLKSEGAQKYDDASERKRRRIVESDEE